MTSIARFDFRQWASLKPWRRHSLVLMVSGIAYVMMGVAYICSPSTPAREVALQYAINPTILGMTIPLSLVSWGWWFAVTGLVTIVSSRWPPVSRTWGYTLLTGLSVAWGLFYLAGVAFGNAPLINLTGAILWCVFGFMWWAVSGLIDPKDRNGFV